MKYYIEVLFQHQKLKKLPGNHMLMQLNKFSYSDTLFNWRCDKLS